MDLIIFLVSLDIIASKFLDCYITSIRMESSEFDRNFIYRKLLEKFGFQSSIWLLFFFCVLGVSICIWLLNNYYSSAFQLLYIFTGLFLTTLNLAKAHSNYFRRTNFITERLFK